MADHPFPLADLPADSSLKAAAEDYSDAMKSLRAKHKLSDEDGFFSEAEPDGWTSWKRPRLKEGNASSHEAIEDAILVRRCEDALGAFRAFLDPAALGAIGFRWSAIHSNWGEAGALFEFSTAAGCLSSSGRVRTRVGTAARTLPVACGVLEAMGMEPFLPPPELGKDALVVSIAETTRFRGFGSGHYDGLSLQIVSARVEEDTAARNAFRFAAFLGALRDGVADAGDYEIKAFEIRPARQFDRMLSARRATQRLFVSAGLSSSAAGGERQNEIDRLEGRIRA